MFASVTFHGVFPSCLLPWIQKNLFVETLGVLVLISFRLAFLLFSGV